MFFSDQEADLIRKHTEDETRCADRPQHLSLLQAANKREFEVIIIIDIPKGNKILYNSYAFIGIS